jgi:hypothetical protein
MPTRVQLEDVYVQCYIVMKHYRHAVRAFPSLVGRDCRNITVISTARHWDAAIVMSTELQNWLGLEQRQHSKIVRRRLSEIGSKGSVDATQRTAAWHLFEVGAWASGGTVTLQQCRRCAGRA